MTNYRIIDLPSGSVNDNQLGFIGDPVSGSLSNVSFAQMKAYFQQGITFNTGSFVLTSSYSQDSASFNTRIAAITGSSFNSSSLATTASLNALSASVNTEMVNSYASQSNYTLYSTFSTIVGPIPSEISIIYTSQSVQQTELNALSSSIQSLTGSYLATGSFNSYTASAQATTANVYASQSNYTLTSSFNSFSASYHVDSGSFLSLIASITGSGGGVSAVIFQAYTASTNTQIANVYASESNYLPTSSFTAFSASVNSKLTGSSGGSSSISVLNFIVGDGQSFTPASGSTVFSSSLVAGHSIIQFQQEGLTLAPISRSVAWFSFTSSLGKLNINNSTFVPDTFYQIIYL